MCGEEIPTSSVMTVTLEIPPRVRRRVCLEGRGDCFYGNTSACAEKRPRLDTLRRLLGKYLRVCGEEDVTAVDSPPVVEIPPRVRRRGLLDQLAECHHGNTSACAEKRYIFGRTSKESLKYLRVCGEEIRGWVSSIASMEIPPRVRRRAKA